MNIVKAIEFLQSLGVEMINQDADSQADPRFWVVAENKREYGIDSGYADGEVVCNTDGTIYETVEEFIEFLVENEYLNKSDIDNKHDYDFNGILNMLDDSDFYTCGYKNNENAIAPDTMFLTKKGCQEHINRNGYHYKNPHTYAMTAWRSPQVEMLFNVLKNTDWDEIKKAIVTLGQQEKEPCEYCCDEDTCMPLNWKYGLDHIFTNYNYCLMCSRKLEDTNGTETD